MAKAKAGRRPATLPVVLLLLLTLPALADIPAPSDPARLIDLRWLARPGEPTFLVDTFAAETPLAAAGDRFVVADIAGPGVLRHLIWTGAAELTIELDGQAVWQGVPNERWGTAPPPAGEPEPAPPWQFPLVREAWWLFHCAVPLPFAEHLRILSTNSRQQAWVAGTRLDHPPKMRFGDPDWLAGVARAVAWLRPVAGEYQWGNFFDVTDLPGGTTVRRHVACAAGARATLFAAAGAGEITDLRLHLRPPAPDLRRYLEIEITVDGAAAPCVRLPLLAFLGVTHAWPSGWAWILGDPAAGWRMPGWHSPYERAWWHFPIPYANGIRIDLVNRSPDRPQDVEAWIRTMPGDPAATLRLCGTARRLPLPMPEGSADLLAFPAAGRLVAFSCFTTGHQALWIGDHAWRTRHRFALGATGGVPLLPFALWPNNDVKPFNLTWNMASWGQQERMGGTRHFWLDPLPLAAGEILTYTAGGPNGPTDAEVAALWYQEAPYAAPPLGPVKVLPVWHEDVAERTEPGGWAAEAEDLLPAARPTRGDVGVATAGALDARVAAGKYLAWDPIGPGDALDLLVETPASDYVEVWLRPVQLPSGGVFGVRLVAAAHTAVAPLWRRGDPDFLGRVLGRVAFPYVVDCFGAWAWEPWFGNRTRGIVRNPVPGRPGRLRFVCGTTRGRAYRLALDQLGMNPAPPPPPGWHEFETLAPTRLSPGVRAAPLDYGQRELSGWGARELTAGPGQEAVFPLLELLPPTGADRLEIRFAKLTGAWTVDLGGDPVPLDPEAGVVVVPLPAPASPWQGTLTLRCTAQPGALLLDAWRLTGMAE